ncbi:MAG: hypothetical protein QGF67_04160 [Lentisphaeria bacterium]|jgi:hypothetical protein|nr:hypothetical protein [Lentisphaeria bacterium]MDP7740608.1 hypothetical protein [Lentisphaeria bacterium]
MQDDVQVQCPGCRQQLVVAPQHIGAELECPQCRTRFEVPDGNQEVEIPPDEIAMLERRDATVVARLKELTARPMWHYAVLSAVLANRMQGLTQSVHKQDRQKQGNQSIFSRSKGRFLATIDQDGMTYCDIVNGLQDMLIQHLASERMPPEPPASVACGDVVEPYCVQLAEFHEAVCTRSLFPGDTQQQIQLIIMGWVPYAWQTLNNLVIHLEAASQHHNDNREAYAMSNVFIPPSFALFHHYRTRL